MNKKEIIEIARIKLPMAVGALNQANLEAQGTKPDIEKLAELLTCDALDGFYDICELVHGYTKAQRIMDKHRKAKEEDKQ